MTTIENLIDEKLHWYKDAIIYELHIKAFNDGNADGIGDFVGLMEKLDYLQNLGITAIWLLPFYPSPLRDDGYDIADYYSINPSYGNIEQFKKLLEEAHRRGLRVITELVINHTSDQHPWFQQARRAPKDSPERNFYVWTDDPEKYGDTRIIFQDFEPSNWTWDPVAKQYYWHRFFHHQPDLNYDNPEVQAEVFKIIDYWCEMGVDGFRLDAVPYLFEREGTNCENLPETHEYLKKLRAHVDKKYPGTLLLAEANMWPEDSASYFGNGDECNMNYHFPIMPRMFMAIQMEDKYPIIDIYDQTPEIPETCQWAIFLRNHDELTLEMVTDEERDYMYKVYVKDPKARINLGIRHRLAPLMDNDRRKIELLNYLLFSLPGTPVIYYGDEIGMGDNFYLGDRDGVRTPMQWSGNLNAGFSRANPQQLYLPVISDPLYQSDAVNVEIQLKNPNSLFWSMKRLINTRRNYKTFSRGSMKFIRAENQKVLAFTRTYQNDILLVVVNFSRYAQPAELDLAEYNGYLLTEIFSDNAFPEIKNDAPYFLTLSPYECLWFTVEKQDHNEMHEHPLYTLEAGKWDGPLPQSVVYDLEKSVLPSYLQKVRWFGGKARAIHAISIAGESVIHLPDENIVMLIIEVSYKIGFPEMYQLALACTTATEDLKNNYPKAIVCEIKINGEAGMLYDAVYNEKYRDYLFRVMASREKENFSIDELQFSSKEKLKEFAASNETVKSKILAIEQSNTSIAYENAFYLKIFRKVDRIINPDVEITRFLSEKTDFKNLPAYIGTIEWTSNKGNIVLAMMQDFIENSVDGWAFMQDRLGFYYEHILTKSSASKQLPLMDFNTDPVPYEDLPVEVKEFLDATVAERMRTLGTRTGEMHLALASDNNSPEFKPEDFSLHYQRSLYSAFQSQVRLAFQLLEKNMKKLPDDVRAEAAEIMTAKDKLLEHYKNIYRKKFDIIKIRTHGDFHLGQTLFTGKDIIIADFEGEPASTFSERRIKRGALRDIAGMVRSFHYAAYGSLCLNKNIRKEDLVKLYPFAEMWRHYMSEIFLNSYLQTTEGSELVPETREDVRTLLDCYIMEKGVYELAYELNNRPDWAMIPVKGIKSILRILKL